MKNLYLYLILIFSPFLTFSQEFTKKAEQNPRLDEHGNVLNNIIDKQGMKQGDWFYLDLGENQVAKKVFVDDKCQATFLNVNGEWINTQELDTNSEFEKEAIEELKSHGIQLNKNRQVLFVLDESGDVILETLLGDWEPKDKSKVLSILKTHINELNIKASTKVYILI